MRDLMELNNEVDKLKADIEGLEAEDLGGLSSE